MPGHTEWKKGQSGNPAGRPKAGVQSFKDRLAYWLETKTYGEIKALVDDPGEKKIGKLLAIDVMVLHRIRSACRKEGTQDFIAVLDRLLGKPAITGELQMTHALGERLDQAEKILGMSAALTLDGEAREIRAL